MAKLLLSRAALLVPVFVFAGAIATPVVAQDKKPAKATERATKVWIDNEHVRVTESVFKPGEVNPMVPRGNRVNRILKGTTTIERTHADGKTEMIEWKEGSVLFSPADRSSSKNIGKSEVVIYTVILKK